ncbi:porin [Piscinibacter sakaiensis]|uniref:porin n=1 Tax=Piscinibacter sakaiensis TaxID=1547922 RepID=UPI003AAEB506
MRSLLQTATLATLTLLPMAGMADVRIYGRLDLAPLYQTNPRDGVNWRLEEVSANRFGFKGSEKLGKDLDAFFQLEHRFYLDTGAERSGARMWTDKAWVGLKSRSFGALSMGRVLTVGNSIVGGSDTEAMTDSAGAINSRKGRIENNMNNGLFYESPWFTPVGKLKTRVSAHYVLPEVKDIENPWGLGFEFRQAPFLWDIGYQHDVYRDASAPAAEDRKSNSWFTGAAWDFGQYEVKATYAHSKGYKGVVSDHSLYRMTTGSLSLNAHFGRWDLGVMGTKKLEKNTSGVVQPEINKFAVGYWYNFSKRTKFMPTIAYEELSGPGYKPRSNGFGRARDKRENVYIEIGFRHEF